MDVLRKCVLTGFLSIETLAKGIRELTSIQLGNTQRWEYSSWQAIQGKFGYPMTGQHRGAVHFAFRNNTSGWARTLPGLISFCNYVSQNTSQAVMRGPGLCMCGTCVCILDVSQLMWAERIWHFHLHFSLSWGVGNCKGAGGVDWGSAHSRGSI